MQMDKLLSGIRVVGFDPSLRNWGVSRGLLTINDLGVPPTLTIDEVAVIQPVLTKNKQVRQNSEDLEAANQLAQGALAFAKGAQAIFVEVPVGSQSARAMASYGVCVGVLGALRAMGIPFFEVSPKEVKMATVGKATASKLEMIEWAMTAYPQANWPVYTQHGKTLVSEAKAEHMADATAAIQAGINTNSFKQTLHLISFRNAT